MNKVILMGRLTRKPEISWNEGRSMYSKVHACSRSADLSEKGSRTQILSDVLHLEKRRICR